MSCVLDASVVLALWIPDDAHHAAATTSVRARQSSGDALILPASAFAEALVGPHRVSEASAQARKRQLLATFSLRLLDDRIADAAARLRARHRSLRLPDALVLATGEIEDADVLTADARWPQYSSRVVVV